MHELFRRTATAAILDAACAELKGVVDILQTTDALGVDIFAKLNRRLQREPDSDDA